MVLAAATFKIIHAEMDLIEHTVVKIYNNVHIIHTLVIRDVPGDSLKSLHAIDNASLNWSSLHSFVEDGMGISNNFSTISNFLAKLFYNSLSNC